MLPGLLTCQNNKKLSDTCLFPHEMVGLNRSLRVSEEGEGGDFRLGRLSAETWSDSQGTGDVLAENQENQGH